VAVVDLGVDEGDRPAAVAVLGEAGRLAIDLDHVAPVLAVVAHLYPWLLVRGRSHRS
jgi:hypothetical protein